MIPFVFRPFSTLLTSITPNIFTSFTPFSLSISVSFGGSQPLSLSRNQDEQANTPSTQLSETYIPQKLVIGTFFAIFLAQVGINFLQMVRGGRRRRQAMELQFPHPLPQLNRRRN
jgi:hypothetical protein